MKMKILKVLFLGKKEKILKELYLGKKDDKNNKGNNDIYENMSGTIEGEKKLIIKIMRKV